MTTVAFGKSFNPYALLRKRSVDTMVTGAKLLLTGLIGLSIFLCLLFLIRYFLRAVPIIETPDLAATAANFEMNRQIKTGHRGSRQGANEVLVMKKLFAPLGSATPAPTTASAAANTPFALVGTFLSDGEPYAIIEDSKKKVEDVFVKGDSVFDEAKVLAIHRDRVEISRNGVTETLVLDDSPSRNPEFKDGVAAGENDEYIVQEAELDTALENLPLLLTQARAVPYFKDGKSVGLRMFAIKAGSLFEKIGLKNGDILMGINGNSLADLSQAMGLFEKLKTERSLSLSLERDRVQKQFSYQIR